MAGSSERILPSRLESAGIARRGLGITRADPCSMTARHYKELIAWQLADRLQDEVYGLVLGSREARNDLRCRSQILEAVDGIGVNIVEGFLRHSAADFCRFLDYALSSLGEAERRLMNGVKRMYFDDAACAPARQLARRALTAIVRLKQSQLARAKSKQRLSRRSEGRGGAPS